MSEPAKRRSPRPRGTGSLYEYRGAWYATWRVGGRQIKRKVGPMRKPGTKDGLTQTQAEAQLRFLIGQTRTAGPGVRRTLKETGDSYLQHLEHELRRKPSTLQDYGIILRLHLDPLLGSKSVADITSDHVREYMRVKREGGLAEKTISNHVTFLHGLCGYAVKKGWATANPVDGVDRPREEGGDPDIRFLDLAELEALMREVPQDVLGGTEQVLYLTAAMTGLRQGELIALRWRDVDWKAGKIRVRQSRTRGRLGKPKSRRGVRAVPMSDRLAGALDRHFQATAFQGDEDLVFAHPQTGSPYDPSKMRSRFYSAIKRAGITRLRFHDLRHTFGTLMAAAGVPMRTLQEWMGYANLTTTEIYAHYAPQPDDQKWVERAFRDQSPQTTDDMPAREGSGGGGGE